MNISPASIQVIFRILSNIQNKIMIEYPKAISKIDIKLDENEDKEFNELVSSLLRILPSLIKNKKEELWWKEKVMNPLINFQKTDFLQKKDSNISKYTYFKYAFQNVQILMQNNNINEDLAA